MGVASDTALSAITAGAMIHWRIHLGMSWRAINHLYCKTSQNPASSFSVFGEVYECPCAGGEAWLCMYLSVIVEMLSIII